MANCVLTSKMEVYFWQLAAKYVSSVDLEVVGIVRFC